MKRRMWIAGALSAAMLAAVQMLNAASMAVTPTAVLLSPGLMAGMIVMGGVDPEANTPPTALSLAVMYSVNFMLYGGLWYVALSISAMQQKRRAGQLEQKRARG